MAIKLNLNQDWKFHRGDINAPIEGTPKSVKTGFARGAAMHNALDASWQNINIPHDWLRETDPVPWELPYQGYASTGIAWYRKQFRFPKDITACKVFLEFEGISRNATVYVNGFDLGSHKNGYTPFWCDITNCVPYYLFQEEDKPQNHGQAEVIAVRVDTREPEGWWYEGGGIYRHVWLHIWDKLHFAPYGVWWSTPEVSEKYAIVNVFTTIVNEYDKDKNVQLRIHVLDGSKVIVQKEKKLFLQGGNNESIVDLRLDFPYLWSPEQPHLYTIKTELVHNEKILHTYEVPLGIRSFYFDPRKGFFLNSKAYKIKGTSAHQDFAGVGIAMPDRLHEKRVEILKNMGCNAFRCAHNPPAPAFLDACDRLGLLVMDENRKLAVSHEDIDDLELLIKRDRAHPSIFIWNLCNEEFATTRPLAARALKTNYHKAKRQDPQQRPIAASFNLWTNNVPGNCASHTCVRVVDVVGINYALKEYDALHKRFQDYVMIPTEFQSLNWTRGIYQENADYPVLAYIDKPLKPADYNYGNIKPTTLKGVLRGWKIISERDYIGGGFLWIGMDHRGEMMKHEHLWPTIIRTNAPIDYCGFPKDLFYFFKACWNKEPLVHIFPHWTWPNRIGQTVYMRVFSNCEKIDFFVNGKSQGIKKMPGCGVLEWKLTYEPGEIKAVGYRSGQEVSSEIIRTARSPAVIGLLPDKTRIQANGCDLACVRIEIKDQDGTLVPDNDRTITITISGPGKLLGIGNGNPIDHTLESLPFRSTFKGLALAIVQSTTTKGEICIMAESPGIKNSRVNVNCV